MKSKILKILGVGLTLVLVVSLTIAIAAPVSAGENEWSSPAKPAKAGSDGDWFYSGNITEAMKRMVISGMARMNSI